MQQLWLNKNAERRLYQGHLWIYNNEIDNAKSPLKNFQAGEIAIVMSQQGKAMGQAYVNPLPLISARLLTSDTHCAIDKNFFLARMKSALILREKFFAQPFYRLIYSESDRLPGLIVDRYDDVLVCQFNTAGIDALRESILAALIELFNPGAIILRNDSSSRHHEELPNIVEVAYGAAPEFLRVIENKVEFFVPALTGQKTGWFYDHRDNRQRVNQLVQGKRVLDVFSYMGGWGIQALCHGAKQVVSLDSSAIAMAQQIENAKYNNVAERLVSITGDAFEELKHLKHQGEKFDVIILDPPALIKRKKDLHAGMQAYFYLNKIALELLAPGGLLVSASCSHHLNEADLISMLQQLSEKLRLTTRLAIKGHQAADHPVHLAIPETEYLKACFITT